MIKWYFIKKKYKLKDLEDLPEEEQLQHIIANGTKIPVKWIDNENENHKNWRRQMTKEFNLSIKEKL
jgi:ribulose bisphosphate carboxylase small subunit